MVRNASTRKQGRREGGGRVTAAQAEEKKKRTGLRPLWGMNQCAPYELLMYTGTCAAPSVAAQKTSAATKPDAETTKVNVSACFQGSSGYRSTVRPQARSPAACGVPVLVPMRVCIAPCAPREAFLPRVPEGRSLLTTVNLSRRAFRRQVQQSACFSF